MMRLRLSLWIALTFILTPTMCFIAWLVGYGPGGLREFRSGYMLPDLVWTMIILGVINFVSVFASDTPKGQFIAVFAVGVPFLLALLYWFGIAAAIAHV